MSKRKTSFKTRYKLTTTTTATTITMFNGPSVDRFQVQLPHFPNARFSTLAPKPQLRFASFFFTLKTTRSQHSARRLLNEASSSFPLYLQEECVSSKTQFGSFSHQYIILPKRLLYDASFFNFRLPNCRHTEAHIHKAYNLSKIYKQELKMYCEVNFNCSYSWLHNRQMFPYHVLHQTS